MARTAPMDLTVFPLTTVFNRKGLLSALIFLDITYFYLATWLFACLVISHYFALKDCALNNWWRVLFSFFTFCIFMVGVSAVPMFNLSAIEQNHAYIDIFSRSIVEEGAKVLFCYVAFETLSQRQVRKATLAFCSLVAAYETSTQGLYILSALSEGYQFLQESLPTEHELLLDKLERNLPAAELVIFTGYQILRIFVHFYLTYAGIYFLTTKNYKWFILLPLLAHGVLNQVILYFSVEFEKSFIITVAQCLCAIVTIGLMAASIRRIAIKHNLSPSFNANSLYDFYHRSRD
ncbi:hypothetical protein [Alteromonas ponticola]|uniref:YhfC family intramembrane metalloprotease n=1 Tax=Alteromonas ponticola TaxID=2720613 RepID=A0ABX1R1P6_9ALTE|nr:hypothetical protein [Alteromonas ponticola]NMH59846.1 hypothetical protein [Alteromonas ponticola]